MRNFILKMAPRWRVVMALAVIVLVGGALASVSAATHDGQNRGQDVCCFTNPQYAGVCQVTPTPDETCESILAYLNNPMSSGKSYCKNTEIRGGWKSIECHSSSHKKRHPRKPQ